MLATGGLISSGSKLLAALGAFGSAGSFFSAGGILPDAYSSRAAWIADCTWLGVGCCPFGTEASRTLRWRSVAALSIASWWAMSMVFVVMPGSAPRASSAVIAAARFCAAANISGV